MAADFVLAGAAAAMAKSVAAPLERVKLLLQNQNEKMKRGHLKRPYKGIGDSFKRVFTEEGVLAFWRGNQANVIRYFPTQERQARSQRQHKGLLDVYRRTLSSDGVVGLYRGFNGGDYYLPRDVFWNI